MTVLPAGGEPSAPNILSVSGDWWVRAWLPSSWMTIIAPVNSCMRLFPRIWSTWEWVLKCTYREAPPCGFLENAVCRPQGLSLALLSFFRSRRDRQTPPSVPLASALPSRALQSQSKSLTMLSFKGNMQARIALGNFALVPEGQMKVEGRHRR